jgi:hypothetical protein
MRNASWMQKSGLVSESGPLFCGGVREHVRECNTAVDDLM